MCSRRKDLCEEERFVVSLNARDGTHPNSGIGAHFPAVEPGRLPRRDRTAMRWRVVYLWAADKYFGPLPSRRRSVNQTVIRP